MPFLRPFSGTRPGGPTTARLRWLRASIVVGTTTASLLAGAATALADHTPSGVTQSVTTTANATRPPSASLPNPAVINPSSVSIPPTGGQVPTASSSQTTYKTVWQSVSWSTAHVPSFSITPDGVIVRSLAPAPVAVEGVLSAPYHSQFDGTVWAEGNCGPTTLSMALGALNIDVDQLTLRGLANRQMGIVDPNDGTTWESLAYAAHAYGVSTEGLNVGKSYKTWTLEDLKAELAQGRPVMLLVRYWDLPDHVTSTYAGDHYIVVLGVDANGNIVYHDSATRGDGSYRKITQSQLIKAWTQPANGMVRTAMAFYR